MAWTVDTDSDVPPSRQLVELVLDAIATGELEPGSQLPSVRAMAAEAMVNHNTVAREHAERAGLAKRARTLAGSAFDVEFREPGEPGFDAILVTNFLHHFEREACVRFLGKCRAALAPRGRVAVLEFALADDRVTPPHPAAFDLVMLATTPRGECYTVSEYEKMFTDAGLARPERHDLPGGSHAVLVAPAR